MSWLLQPQSPKFYYPQKFNNIYYFSFQGDFAFTPINSFPLKTSRWPFPKTTIKIFKNAPSECVTTTTLFLKWAPQPQLALDLYSNHYFVLFYFSNTKFCIN